MINVHFLGDKKDAIIDYLLTPIRCNKKELLQRGYRIKIYYHPTKKCLECDILCLVSKKVLRYLGENSPVCQEEGPTITFLKNARKTVSKIIWFDSSDSTSVTHFELLPFIDLYLKKQLFKDKNLYKKNFYGGRVFSEFYHYKFKVKDKAPFTQFYPLKQEDWYKVSLSWNIGLGDMYNAFSPKTKYRRLIPDHWVVRYRFPVVSPSLKKTTDIFLSTNANLKRPTIAFHRQKIIEELRNLIKNNGNLTGQINGNRLPLKQFRKALADSKILPSPFGWGELGVRDYEAFINGAVLLKPDISHMETWPDIFKENESYMPIKWDFSNLEESTLELLGNDEKRIEIATKGQNLFLKSISDEGMEVFCNKFIDQLNR